MNWGENKKININVFLILINIFFPKNLVSFQIHWGKISSKKIFLNFLGLLKRGNFSRKYTPMMKFLPYINEPPDSRVGFSCSRILVSCFRHSIPCSEINRKRDFLFCSLDKKNTVITIKLWKRKTIMSILCIIDVVYKQIVCLKALESAKFVKWVYVDCSTYIFLNQTIQSHYLR